ncbi:MAG: GntR family transcriptional regulator [Pyramidobacter sp.]|nr:GntR family transcriptional regulator [Pyramidobacter sp.]
MALVNRDSLSVFVAAYLREQIFLRRSCRPGDYIREMELSSALGVSRGPVRDAIKKLESEGVLEASPWKGAQVVTLTDDDRQDIEELCALLEKRLTDIISKKGLSAAARTELGALAEGMGQCAASFDSEEARERLGESEERFHDILFETAAHPWTEKALRKVYSQVRLARLGMSEQDSCAQTARACAELLAQL